MHELKEMKNEVLDRLHVYLGYYREIEADSETMLEISNTLREQADVIEGLYRVAKKDE